MMETNNRVLLLIVIGCIVGALMFSEGGPNSVVNGRVRDWSTATTEVPGMNLPESMRMHNYAGGSCVHASTESHMRWLGQEAWADWWRATYSGGEGDGGLMSKLDRAGLKYIATTQGDVSVLDQASQTHRGAVIFYKPSHSINFVGWAPDNNDAMLLDNNHTSAYERVPHDQFVKAWHGYGGFALTLVYFPTPPTLVVR